MNTRTSVIGTTTVGGLLEKLRGANPNCQIRFHMAGATFDNPLIASNVYGTPPNIAGSSVEHITETNLADTDWLNVDLTAPDNAASDEVRTGTGG